MAHLNQQTKEKAFTELEKMNANILYTSINARIIKRGLRILFIVSIVNLILLIVNLFVK